MKFATPLHVIITCSGVVDFIAVGPCCLICQILLIFSGVILKDCIKVQVMCLRPPKKHEISQVKNRHHSFAAQQTFYFYMNFY